MEKIVNNAPETFSEMPLEEQHRIAFNQEVLELATNVTNMAPRLVMILDVLATARAT